MALRPGLAAKPPRPKVIPATDTRPQPPSHHPLLLGTSTPRAASLAVSTDPRTTLVWSRGTVIRRSTISMSERTHPHAHFSTSPEPGAKRRREDGGDDRYVRES